MRKAVRTREKEPTGIVHHCRDCANSHDWHHAAVDGHMTLARCPFRASSILLSDPQCKHFRIRNADTE